MTERLLFPFGVYNTERCAMCWIGLYENEADCWETFLGWPTKEEIDFAKSQGLVVLPLMVNYDPPKTTHPPVRIKKTEHAEIPKTGNFEVRFNDGRPSKYFHWDDEPSRRLRPEQMDQATALEAAKTFAREERDKIQGDTNQQERKIP